MSRPNILPPAEILKKLQISQPDSATWILNRFEAIGKEEHERQEREFLKKALKPNWKGFLQGLSNLFNSLPFGASRREEKPVIVSDTVEYSWIFTGNILRLAIRQYCAEHPDVADKAGLTLKDWADLEPMPYPAPSRGENSQVAPALAQ